MRVLGGVLTLCLVLGGSLAYAETYIGGMLGMNMPQKASNITALNGAVGVSDQELADGLLVGGKVGNYFNDYGLSWLGAELEVTHANPNVLGQNATLTGSEGSTSTLLAQTDLSVTMVGFNAVARYPGEHWQPYGGLGLGVFMASMAGGGSATALGLNAQVGLRYMLDKKIGLFGEYKYGQTDLSFDTVSARYQASGLGFGVSVHF